ncbi:911_t:CDS:2, partial [Dentiscutata heterogama]
MSTNPSYNLQETLLHCDQDELQEFLTDVQTLENEDNYNDDPLFNFKQNLYERALDLTEHEDDPWKELNAKDTVGQDINYEEIEKIEEIGSEYSEEIPATTQKPTTLCVIIDNDYGEIRRCNRISNKRLQELVSVWKIDANAVEEVNRQLQLFGVYKSEIVKSTSFLSSVILTHAFRSWKFWLPQIVGSFCERPKLASYLHAILRAANVVAYSKDYE